MNYSVMTKLIIGELNKENENEVNILVSSKMTESIQLWSAMYGNNAPWVDRYTVFSANLPPAIASEIARLITLELKTEVKGSPRADYINNVYKNLLKELRKYTEYGCAKGGLIFKPYVTDMVQIEFIQADNFFPLVFDSNGNITYCAFVAQVKKGKYIYTRLETHRLLNNGFEVINRAYQSTTDAVLGSRVPLETIDEWNGLSEKVTYGGVDKLPFGYFKVPLANTIDTDSPLGVSVFSRAIELIKEADIRYSGIKWEYQSKETAIHIAESLLDIETNTGNAKVPKNQERTYRLLNYNSGAQDKPLIDHYSPDIRHESFFTGLNNQLKLVEFNCSLAYGTLSDPQQVEKTAEEIRSSKQRSFTFVSDAQLALQRALEDTIDAIDMWVTIYNLAPIGKYETSFDWDDSIIVDPEKERLQDRQDVAMGVMSLAEYRSKWYGETIEKAQENLPEVANTEI